MDKKNKKEIKKYYSSSRVVDNYNKRRFRGLGGRYINKKEIEPILRLATKVLLSKKKKVLDLGAGRGRLSKSLINNGFDVYCLDSSFEMTKKLSNLVNKKRIFLQSIFEQIKTKEKFDLITSLRFFDHFSLKDQEKVIKNITKNLNKDGYIIFSCLNKNSLEYFLARFFPYRKFNYFYTNKQFRDMFKKNNYLVLDCKGSFVIPRGIFLYMSFSVLLTRILTRIDKFLVDVFPSLSANLIYLIKAK